MQGEETMGTLYEEDFIEFVVDTVGCSEEEARGYWLKESEYFVKKGMQSGYDTDIEWTRDELIEYEEIMKSSEAPIIEVEKMLMYIEKETGINMDVLEGIEEAEMKYLEMQGLVG